MKPMIAVIFVMLHAAWPVHANDDDQVTLPPLVPSRGVYSLTLAGRSACVTPSTKGQARAEGGEIEITAPRSDTLVAVLSGSVAANAYLGCPGSAAERFGLLQEFEIACSDKNVKTAKLTLDGVLAGFVRSKHRAGAGMRLASARVCPLGSTEPVMIITHPPLGVAGSDGRHCNQHLPELEKSGVPLGRYSLYAELILEADAAGLASAHAQADFSPSGSLPSDWVRTRDPFQGVDKKNFGFSLTITVEAEEETKAVERKIRQSNVCQAVVLMPAQNAPAPRQYPINEKGFGRLFKP